MSTQKRKKDGKTYLVGRNSFTSKLLILPNDEKASDKEPDFWVFVVEDEVKPKNPDKPCNGCAGFSYGLVKTSTSSL